MQVGKRRIASGDEQRHVPRCGLLEDDAGQRILLAPDLDIDRLLIPDCPAARFRSVLERLPEAVVAARFPYPARVVGDPSERNLAAVPECREPLLGGLYWFSAFATSPAATMR